MAVEWCVIASDGTRKLHLGWTERNGTAVEEPAHRGFGMVLLQRVLPARCDAQVRLSFPADGLRFELDAPMVTHRHVPQY